jgi:hypothetical protein
MSDEPTPWALVGADNVCISVQMATAEWIAEHGDPGGGLRYIATAYGTGYAGIGYTFDKPTGWFIPPASDFPEGWVFDRDPDVWSWVDPNAPDTP